MFLDIKDAVDSVDATDGGCAEPRGLAASSVSTSQAIFKPSRANQVH